MSNKALGLLEVEGYSVALASVDAASKSTNIDILGMDCNNPIKGDLAQIPVVVQVRITGNIEDVKMALEIAREKAAEYISEDEIKTHCISSYSDDLAKVLPVGKVKIK